MKNILIHKNNKDKAYNILSKKKKNKLEYL